MWLRTVVFFASCSNATHPCCCGLWGLIQITVCSWRHCRETTASDQDWKVLNVLAVVIGVSVSFVYPLPYCGQSAMIGTGACFSRCVQLQPHIAFACPCNYMHLCTAFSTPLSHSHPLPPPPRASHVIPASPGHISDTPFPLLGLL